MTPNWVDLLVVVSALTAVYSGWRSGVAAAVLAFVGVVTGAVLGLRLAPVLVDSVQGVALRAGLGVLIVLALIAVGQSVGVLVGRAVRAGLRLKALRAVDSILGAAVQAVAVLVVAWLLAVPLSQASGTGLAGAVRSSAVLAEVDRLLPVQAQRLPAEFGALLDTSGLPDVLGPFVRTPVTDVDPPRPVDPARVAGLRASVLKIRGSAPSCSRGLEGSGFVIAPQRVLTNAHVVAGTDDVAVESGGALLRARVVLFDAGTDVAVLAVPGLAAPPLAFDTARAGTGTPAVVIGYPMDGPFTAVAARIREGITLRGPDIYDSRTVTRQVYTVRADIRSGNSGGPLVDDAGQVLGVVFGAAVDAPDTGFALTAREVADEVARAPALAGAVDTGACTA